MKRFCAALLFALPTFAFATVEGDAGCKVNPPPPGFVAVSEMESGECPGYGEGGNNAWIYAKLSDGIVSCAEPDYRRDPAPNISYVVTKKVHSQACSPSPDGTANAYVLKHVLSLETASTTMPQAPCENVYECFFIR